MENYPFAHLVEILLKISSLTENPRGFLRRIDFDKKWIEGLSLNKNAPEDLLFTILIALKDLGSIQKPCEYNALTYFLEYIIKECGLSPSDNDILQNFCYHEDPFNTLKELLQSLDKEQILSAYQIISIPLTRQNSFWACPVDKNRQETIEIILKKLFDETDKASGIPYRMQFVISLIVFLIKTNVESDIKKLQDWLENERNNINKIRKKIAEAEMISLDAIDKCRNAIREKISTNAPSALLIELKPHSERLFWASMWQYHDTKIETVNLSHKVKTVGNAGLFTQDELVELLWKPGRLCINIPDDAFVNFRYEFFLPFSLLNEEVDKWQNANLGESLGIHYPVVLRLAERHKERDYVGLWKNCWKYVEQSKNNTIHFVKNLNDCESKSLMYHLSKPEITCLALYIPPPNPLAYHEERSMFRKLVETGTPIALWPRKEFEFAEIEKLWQMVCYISDLPKIVTEWRREPGNILGEELSLIWEDPNIILTSSNLTDSLS